MDGTLSYLIQVGQPEGYSFSPQDVLDAAGDPQDAVDSDVDSVGVFPLSPGSSPVTVDAGLYLTPGSASIGDVAWLDANADGVQDYDEYGLLGVRVDLTDEGDSMVATAYTDEYGGYQLADVDPGTYTVAFTPPSGASFSTGNATQSVTVYAGQHAAVNAGLFYPGSVAGRAWDDADDNGIRDAGEQPRGGVDVGLFSADGDLVASTTTDANGQYTFGDVTPGNYEILFGRRPAGRCRSARRRCRRTGRRTGRRRRGSPR